MSHKALVFIAPAEPCQLADRQTPKPGPGQVLIKNVAVALNPVDYVIVHLGIWVDHYGYPALAGIDGAGEIVAIGEGVDSKWNVGDRVLYKSLYHPDTMTFQEFSVSDALQMAKIPSDVTFEGAATIPLGFGTAAVGLYQELKPHGGIGLTPPWEVAGNNKYAGQPAIVTAGASSVGQFAIQLLKASGFSPIITTASKHNEEYCLAAGATHVIDYHSVPYAELGAAVKQITSLPIPVIYDAVGWPDVQRALWEILAPQGKLATVFRAVVGEDGKASENDDGKVAVGVYGSANAPFNYEFGKRMFPGVTKLLESGDLKPNQYEVLPRGLAGIPDGLVRLAKRTVSGVKLVARVEESSGEVGGAGLKEAVPPQVNHLRTVYPPGSLPYGPGV